MQIRTPQQAQPRDLRPRADKARMVADVLRRQINDGDMTGTLDESVLIEDFAVSRNTIRDALSILRTERLIERSPRVGTHVVARKLDHGLDALQGLQETFLRHGEIRNAVRIATLVTAPRAVARKLHLNPAEDVVYIERLRCLDDEPISLDITYVAPDIGIPLLAKDLERTDVFSLIEEIAGSSLDRAEVTVEAAAADPHSAAQLEIASGAPILLLERPTHLDDRPVDLEYIRMRSDRLSLRSTAHRTRRNETR